MSQDYWQKGYHFDNWESYKGLGLALNNTQQYPEAIVAFNKSLALHDDWGSYKGLGWALNNTQQYPEAIEAFSKSLALHQEIGSYTLLGIAQAQNRQLNEAVESFCKSLALSDNFFAYQLIAEALIKINTKNRALMHITKLISIMKDPTLTQSNLYTSLAKAYANDGNKQAAIRCWNIHCSITEPCTSIDTYLGKGRNYTHLGTNQLEKLNNTCAANGCEFIPSHQVSNDLLAEPWKYLMYLHIPKCAGSSFVTPLSNIIFHLRQIHRDTPNLIGTKHFLVTENLEEDRIDALADYITNNAINTINGLFAAPFNATWNNLYNRIEANYNVRPRVITTVRDPRKRLFSHIRHKSYECKNLSELIELIECNNSIFNNSIYRHIYNCNMTDLNNLSDTSATSHSLNGTLAALPIEDIDILDISDTSTAANIKSAFLSSTLLPNIVQYSRINESKERDEGGSRYRQRTISDDELINAYNLCLKKGFLLKDESIDYNFLVNRTLRRLRFPSYANKPNHRIHPLTFVVSGIHNPHTFFVVPTEQFLSDPLSLIQKINS